MPILRSTSYSLSKAYILLEIIRLTRKEGWPWKFQCIVAVHARYMLCSNDNNTPFLHNFKLTNGVCTRSRRVLLVKYHHHYRRLPH